MRMYLSKIAVLLMVMVLAQHTPAGDFGLKLGPQRSHLDDSAFNLGHFKIGLFYTIPLGGRLKLNPEIYFSHLGSRAIHIRYSSKELSRPIDEQYEDRLSYIEIPLLLTFSVPTRGNLEPVVFAGGYIAIRVSQNLALPQGIDWQHPWENREYWSQSEYLTYTEGDSALPYTNDDIYHAYAGSEGGVVLGIGLEHSLGSGKLIFDWRLNLGLTNIYRASPDARERRNNAMTFMIGLGF
jgi:hypothetical protein